MSTLLERTEFDTLSGKLVRLLRRRHNDRCINIVTYHRIAKPAGTFLDKVVPSHDPAEFEEQIDYLAEHYKPLRLSELVSSLERDEPVNRAVVLTFDDGYADSIGRAMPILFRRRIPMTVFPVTSVIGNDDLLWQHKLAWLSAHGHEQRVTEAFKSSGYPPQAEGESAAHFARRCFRHDMPDILESVLQSVGQTGRELASSLRPYVEREEVANADPEFVEFGNHTHTHPILSTLAADAQREEIAKAADILASLTGYPPVSLAYPFGLKNHYNAESRAIAQETRHRATLDMRRRFNVGRVDPFELSRKPATRGSQEGFERMIEDWPANAPPPANGGVE